MAKTKKTLHPDAPLLHRTHKRPVTRRDFIGQGLMAGFGLLAGPSILGALGIPRKAQAALSADIDAMRGTCGITTQGAGKIPFICFDLAGGANISGSNVLVGKQGGQLDFLSTAGYSKMGLPGDMIPPVANPNTGTNDFINTQLGLAFHSDSAFLRGILEKAPGALGNTNGAVIPARSDNDTGNNPHNPMYGIASAGADGELLTLIGSRSSDSGGNSMAPAELIDLGIRPTKVDRPSDVTGMVDTGELINVMTQEQAVRVMEAVTRISNAKLGAPGVDTGLSATEDAAIKELVRCGYVKSADLVDRFADPGALDPASLSPPAGIPQIVGAGGIFTEAEFNGEGEFRKTASVMKMVIDGYAGAGTITMGGFDYHTGDRSTGEVRDLRAGRCIGACLEYAARANMPLMIYVFSDGSVASNGMIDNSVDGRGKGVWTGDNSSTASSFFLVYNPGGRPQLLGGTPEEQARHQQLGWFRADGSVETGSSPAANNVNLLVQTVILNYLALHDDVGSFASVVKNPGLGSAPATGALTAFAPIVSGTI